MNNNELMSLNSIEEYDNTEEILCRVVFEFAKNLPYSMDYKDPNFVPGDFMNYMPINPKKFLFKDYGSIYNKMLNWSDTIVSGIHLQVCNIFQKILMSSDEHKHQLSDEDFYIYGFDKLTSMELYNKKIFGLLVNLPKLAKMVNECSDTDDRRRALDTVYELINGVTNYVEKVRKKEVDINDDIVLFSEEIESYYHFWRPHQDLDMMYHFNYIKIWDLDTSKLIDSCREQIASREDVKRLK